MVEAVATAPASVAKSLAERNLRVMLIQIRGLPKAIWHEMECVRQCTGLTEAQLEHWNVVYAPALRWSDVRHADALIIGGSGDHSVTQDYQFMPWLEDVVWAAVDANRPLLGSVGGIIYWLGLWGGVR